jgi:hypothetical protein
MTKNIETTSEATMSDASYQVMPPLSEAIEILYPSLPKIELNRRGPPREGWDAWGLEATEQLGHAEDMN